MSAAGAEGAVLEAAESATGVFVGTPAIPSPPPVPSVVVERLSRRFGKRVILEDISFVVPRGVAFGITGANGSGKTVLLRLVASLDRPTSGRILVLGDDTVRAASFVRRKIGYVSEDPALYEGVTAAQYMHFVGRSRGLGRLVRGANVDTLLQVVGLEHGRAREVRDFSPGERRRLALASALLHEPDVLILDDPLRGLDGQARTEQIEVLRELRRIGSTLLLSATRPEDLLDLCDHVAVLRDGALRWSGSLSDAATLADPSAADGPGGTPSVRVRAEVLAGLDTALALLAQRRDVRELEVDEDGQTVWFLFNGDRDSLAALWPQLIRAGATLAHFGAERRSAASALASLFRADQGAA